MDTSASARCPGGASLVGVPWRRSWRTLLVVVFLLVALAVGAVELAHVVRAYEQARRETLASLLQVARSLAGATELYVGRYQMLAGTAAQAVFSSPLTDRERNRILGAIRATHPEVVSLAAVAPDGRVLASDPDDWTVVNLSDHIYYRRVIEGRSPVVSDLLPGRVTQTYDIVVIGAARATDGTIRGLIAVRPRIAPFIRELEVRLNAHAYPVVVDSTGRVVVHGERANLDWDRRDYSHLPLVAAALTGRSAQSDAFDDPIAGEASLGAMAPVEGLGWAAGVFQPAKTALAPALEERRLAFGTTVAVLALGFGLAVALATALSRPVVALAHGVAAVARGDLGYRVPVRTRSELGLLARHFNDMAARLEAARRQEQARAAEARAAQGRAAFLAEASSSMAASLDYEATLKSVARAAVPVLADGCLIEFVEPDRPVWPVAVAHVEPAREALLKELQRFSLDPAGSHPVVMAVRTGRSHLVADVSDSWIAAVSRSTEHQEVLRALGPVSYLSVPLVARGRTLGVLSFVSNDPARRYGEADVRFAEDLAQRAALAVDNARLFREAQEAIRQAQAAVRAREAFLARASHELRTPLTSAIGTIRMLERAMAGTIREEPAVLIAIASRNLMAMLSLINDLLDASKLTAGREQVALVPLDLAAVVAASVDVVGIQARDKGLTLRMVMPAGVVVSGDRLKLEQVFTNLLGNAVKFTPQGGEILVDAESDGVAVRVRVRDTGEGISREHIESIFEPFVQVGRRSRARQRGTGLGLAICQQIVALHGGRIWAESEGAGRGSVFHVSLPLAAAGHRAA